MNQDWDGKFIDSYPNTRSVSMVKTSPRSEILTPMMERRLSVFMTRASGPLMVCSNKQA